MPNGRPVSTRLAPFVTATCALLASACSDTNLTPDQPATQPLAQAPAKGNSKSAAQRTPAQPASTKETLAAIAEARALRNTGQKTEAQRTLERAAVQQPNDIALLKERGLLALDLGQVGKAETLLRKALDPRSPDWLVHLGLGTALAASGRQQQAQLQFAKALELAPDHPAILNNLALSYALDGKPGEAEKLLRHVAADRGQPQRAGQAKQNLALLLGLSGRIDEAQALSRALLPPDQARTNVDYLKSAAAEQPGAASGQRAPAVAAARDLPEPTYRLGGAER